MALPSKSTTYDGDGTVTVPCGPFRVSAGPAFRNCSGVGSPGASNGRPGLASAPGVTLQLPSGGVENAPLTPSPSFPGENVCSRELKSYRPKMPFTKSFG